MRASQCELQHAAILIVGSPEKVPPILGAVWISLCKATRTDPFGSGAFGICTPLFSGVLGSSDSMTTNRLGIPKSSNLSAVDPNHGPIQNSGHSMAPIGSRRWGVQ